MSIQAVAWAIEQEAVPARPALVLISIANHADHTNGYCYLRAETIAREARCTPRSVFRFVGALIRNGYIRKAPKRGDDGKQRANDYWMLFDREDKPWDWGAHPESDTGDGEVDESEGADAAPQDVVEPDDGVSHGEAALPTDSGVTRRPVEKHAVSSGPCDSRVSHKDSAEPSESKPKASSARARVHRSTLRAYRPPPPQPVADDTEHPTNPIFVYEGTPAYDAWAIVMARRNGVNRWHCTTRKFVEVDQKWRTGWYFPTLFPPAETTGPPRKEVGLSESEMRDFK